MQMDATRLEFPSSSFDVVVSFEVIEHLKNPKAYLSEIQRVLRNRATYLGSTPNKKFQDLLNPPINAGRPYWKWHVKEYFDFEYKTLLKMHFSKVNLLYVVVTRQGYLEEMLKYSREVRALGKVSRLTWILPDSIRKLGRTLAGHQVPIDIHEVKISEERQDEALSLLAVCQK